MFTIIIAIACAVIGAYVCTSVFGLDRNVSICIGIGIFLVLQLLIGLLIRRKINNITGEIQTLMEKTQNKLNRQLSFMQTRPISSPKAVSAGRNAAYSTPVRLPFSCGMI